MCGNNEEYIIDVAAPGMKRDEFKVELDNNVLTISSQREEKHEEYDENRNYTRREFNYHPSNAVLHCLKQSGGEKIAARYADGILHITVPKEKKKKKKKMKRK